MVNSALSENYDPVYFLVCFRAELCRLYYKSFTIVNSDRNV
jgi:hypothetical protein